MPKRNTPKQPKQSPLATTVPKPNPTPLDLMFEGSRLRVSNGPVKRIAVLDVLEAVGYAHPKKSWRDIQSTYPEVVTRTLPLQFAGRRQHKTPTLDKEGVMYLILILEGPKAAAFRGWAAKILVRYLEGDPDLAVETIENNPNPDDALGLVNQRCNSKRSNRLLNQTIKDHGGDCFVQVAIYSCQGATGKTPAVLRLQRGKSDARSAMTIGEVAALVFIEELTRTAIEKHEAGSNSKILEISYAVAQSVKDVRIEFRNKSFHESPLLGNVTAPKPGIKPSPQFSLLLH